MFGLLLAVDAKVSEVTSNPPISPWWRSTFESFYASGRFALVALVGRGGGKSTTLERMALTETLLGSRVVPKGQRFLWPFVSVSIADARQRIHELATAAKALGIEADPAYPSGQPTLEMVDAAGQDVALVALASNVRATSGKTSVGGTIDEEQKLQGHDGANPSAEVVASLVQTFRSSPSAKLVRCSSAYAKGTHSAAVEAGTTEFSYVASLGAAFVAAAQDGYRRVAAWEDAHGNASGATRLRQIADGIGADDARIPAWVANPSLDPVRSREQIEATRAPGGLSPTDMWLRELASVAPWGKGGKAPGFTTGDIRAMTDFLKRSVRSPRLDAESLLGTAHRNSDGSTSRYARSPVVDRLRSAYGWRGGPGGRI